MRIAQATGALLAVATLAGCGTGSSERDATAVVERFQAALTARDGHAACVQLTPATRAALERQEMSRCGRAVLRLPLRGGGDVVDVKIYLDSGLAEVRARGLAFLDQTSAGWRISAAGCRPSEPNMPYECGLES